MVVPVGYESFSYLAVTIHAIISGILIAHTLKTKKERTKRFPLLFASNVILFVVLVLSVLGYWDFTEEIDFLAFIAYSTLIIYILTIEIPGYLFLSRFDEKLSDDLKNIRKDIISLNYSSANPSIFESKITYMKPRLKELLLDDIIENFVASYKRMNQVDRTLYEITLKELGENMQHISTRSKHPFPKLIDIMSLAGISFLIAQFLDHFLT